MPDLDLEPSAYRAVALPRAGRFNAIVVLVVALICLAIVVAGVGAAGLYDFFIGIGVVFGCAIGWAATRIIDPKVDRYVPEDDPTQLRNPPKKTAIGRFFARPAGWDAPGKWLSRLIAALVLGLGVYLARQYFGHH